MNIKMSRQKWLSVGATIVLMVLVWAVSTALAQGPDGEDPQRVAGGSAVGAVAYQGYLEDGGAPANGLYDFQWTIWPDALAGSSGGGAPVSWGCPGCYDNIPVDNGYFTLYLFPTGATMQQTFDGSHRWISVDARPAIATTWTSLGVQAISPVPYAWGLAPGAAVTGGVASPSAVINVVETLGTTWDSPFAVYGQAPSTAIYGDGGAYGVKGFGDYAGVRGDGGLIGVSGDGNQIGVSGHASWPEQPSETTYGLYGHSSSNDGYGVYGYGYGGAGGKFMTYNGSIIEGWEDVTGDGYSNLQRRFRVTYSGNVYADGGYHCGLDVNDSGSGDLSESELDPCLSDNSPADFAEVLAATGDPEPGDVLVVTVEGVLARSTEPYQTSVVGVHSTRPSYVGNGALLGQEGYVPLAVVGLVPVRVSAENGPIVPGDLLATSSTPGHAMRAGDDPPAGTVVGKALEGLESGTGVIQMLVMLQ